jgi:diphthamide synthase (EF-2-diphthine--ammonia ligase)
MYLSHPVRRMRDDPIQGETVSLVVTGESEETVEELEEAIEAAGGSVEKRLQFGALEVTITQERIDDLCNVSGIESIETTNTVGVGGDAGEDLGGE